MYDACVYASIEQQDGIKENNNLNSLKIIKTAHKRLILLKAIRITK